ncbi:MULTISPECIES: sensor histidine kinase [unclassified Pseudofrankia]|uniref:sensor histidine kinase n=1 Tax=unclassified Pseudofrankia TaxID=2994372 RepID=UPI000B1D6157|nr:MULTISPECIES: ATP-binding protein [unclassified Pseudofrankia]
MATACLITTLVRTTAQDQVYLPIALAVLAIPGSFDAAALRCRLARVRTALLLASLPVPPSLADVRNVLRTALRDPTGEIYLWAEDDMRHITASGAPADPPAPTKGIVRVPLRDRDGGPLAVVVLSSGRGGPWDSVHVTVKALAVALENVRLKATADARLEEVLASSARANAAAYEARRQLERDLHDGAQQRLLALGTRLGVARHTATEPDTLAALDAARGDLAAALAELRALARGLYPALLAGGGLAPALEAVADSLPLAVTVTASDERLSPEVEASAYYTVCEALTNAVKHAQATAATVTVARTPLAVVLTVTDDGQGGARTTPDGGLAGLTDRLRTLGGRLTINSPPGRGTTLTAVIPIA